MKEQNIFIPDLMILQIFYHTTKSLSCIGHIKGDAL